MSKRQREGENLENPRKRRALERSSTIELIPESNDTTEVIERRRSSFLDSEEGQNVSAQLSPSHKADLERKMSGVLSATPSKNHIVYQPL